MEAIDLVGDLAVVLVAAGAAGWLCKKLGLSVVVGYLAAGIVVGPYTPPFQLVADIARVEMLAQLGLVFLVFSIGLGLSFARLLRLGASIALATALAALFMWSMSRVGGVLVGWSSVERFFFAGMVMVSSSAIIAKVLEETNLAHERAGQLALGVTVLEDVVAIVMLTLLTPFAQLGSTEEPNVMAAIVRLVAFVAALVTIALLVVPRVLRLVERGGGPELRTLLLAGLVLGVAWTADAVGSSLALGAFVLGAVVAGTRHRVEIERAFDTLKHIFGAVFFVAIGMLLDVQVLIDSAALVVGSIVFVTLARPAATSFALVLVGQPLRDALRAGLTLTPIGEFSFIIAQLGVAAGVVPPSFSAIAVGLALGTAFVGPVLTRRAEAIVDRLLAWTPSPVIRAVQLYQGVFAGLGQANAAQLWAIARPRVPPILFHIVSITVLLLVLDPALRLIIDLVGPTLVVDGDVALLAQIGFALVVMAPLIALWRHLTTVVVHVVARADDQDPRRAQARRALVLVMKVVLGLAMATWMLGLLPIETATTFTGVVVFAVGVAFFVVFGRRMLSAHRWFEDEVRTQFRHVTSPAFNAGLALPILDPADEWELDVDEVVLPNASEHGGKRIIDLELRKRFGCSIVGIDRQGVVITRVAADIVLYPQDRLLLLGARDQLVEAERFLLATATAGDASGAFSDFTTESVVVDEAFFGSGRSLAQLNLIERLGVQVCGIRRAGERLVIPHGQSAIHGGDQLLVLGTHDRIHACRLYFSTTEEPDEDGARTA